MRSSLRLIGFLSAALFAGSAQAGLIRDAEIEHDIRQLADPIFEAADLDPKSVRIFLVADPRINAYVAGGTNIFIHTGLIEAADTPEMLIGVIAHETGHIAGGHLAKGTEAMKNASLGTIISFALGAATAMAGGSQGGQAGAAIMSGGPTAMKNMMLEYSRGNENSADQAGMKFLTQTGMTSEGLLDMFTRLRRDERMHMGQRDPYAMTHPLTSDRISTVRDFIDRSPLKDRRYPEPVQEEHRRMVAKVQGFLDPPDQVAARRKDDHSPAGRYALAIAYFRQSNLDPALRLMDGLLAQEPENPWFNEMKGQMLFENRRIAEAAVSYKKALALAPREPQIRTEYAAALIAGKNPADLPGAIGLLQRSVAEDASYDESWRQLADAFGKNGKEGEAHLALAEEASLADEPGNVKIQADMALKTLSPNSPGALRAQDLRSLAIRQKKEQADRGGGIDRP